MASQKVNREQIIKDLVPEVMHMDGDGRHHLQERWRLRVESSDGLASYYDMARELAIKRGLIET